MPVLSALGIHGPILGQILQAILDRRISVRHIPAYEREADDLLKNRRNLPETRCLYGVEQILPRFVACLK